MLVKDATKQDRVGGYWFALGLYIIFTKTGQNFVQSIESDSVLFSRVSKHRYYAVTGLISLKSPAKPKGGTQNR